MVKQYLATGAAVAPELRMAYVRNLLDAQRYAEASAQLRLVTRDKPDFPEAWLVLGSLQVQDNQLDAAEASLQRYVGLALPQTGQTSQAGQAERSRGLAQAFLLLSQVAEKRKDFIAAEAWLNRIENPEVLLQAQSRRAVLLARQGKVVEGRKLIRELPVRDADEVRARLLAEVNLLREIKDYRGAYELLGQAVADAPATETELLYEQAMMAEKLGSLDEMERLLRRAIERKPDYHHAYNALGYSLADRGVRLPEARELILKAVSYAPNDPFIQDSLGWVEFRLGNRTEALRILEGAYKSRPDPEIAAHFGEVLWVSGQRERAVAIWKEGLLLSADNETLQATLKRLRIKL
jgi:tetratricopeptide (TPR) repeat protein